MSAVMNICEAELQTLIRQRGACLLFLPQKMKSTEASQTQQRIIPLMCVHLTLTDTFNNP